MAGLGCGTGIASQPGGDPSFNPGVNMKVQIIRNDTLQPLDLGGEVVDFNSTAQFHDLKSNPISNGGEPDFASPPDGHHGTVTIDRYNGAMDAFQAEQEALFHATGDFIKCTIKGRIRNPSTKKYETWTFKRADVRLEDSGNWASGALVQQKVTFRASRKDVSLTNVSNVF